jgi:rRNA-processing protein FCF1
MIIIIDTNFLIYSAKYKIDLISELDRLYSNYKIIIPKKVLLELRKLTGMKGKDKFAAQLSLAIIEKMLSEGRLTVKGMESKNADEEIIKLADEIKEKKAVGTMDQELVKKIKNSIILKIRQKKYISE